MKLFKKNKENRTTTLLNELKLVQEQISNCTASIANLEPPTTKSAIVKKEYRYLIEYLIEYIPGGIVGIRELNHHCRSDEAIEYIEKLGNYFVRYAEYHREHNRCVDELKELHIKEEAIKCELGIK